MKNIQCILCILFLFIGCSKKTGTVDNTSHQVEIYGSFKELPLKEIKPKGWIRNFLELQRDGLTGHLDHGGYPFNTVMWADERIDTILTSSLWWPYEQTGSWIDALIRVGYYLNDSSLLKKGWQQINYLLEHPDSSGYLGPSFMKAGKQNDWLAHVYIFHALMAEFSVTGNKTIPEALTKHYLQNKDYVFDSPLEAVNIEIILWLYNHTGNKELLSYAKEIYQQFNDSCKNIGYTAKGLMSGKPVNAHGRTYNEAARLGAILYYYTADSTYLMPSVEAYKKIDQYYMMVDGICVSSEHMHTPVKSLNTHETCDIAMLNWSVGYLLMATGNPEYADKIEKASFNAAPGCVTKDFKALQYFSGPNQVIATQNSNHNKFYRGDESMSFGPNPWTECCAANVNRMIPNYIARMWMKTKDNGIVSSIYGPSEVETNIGGNKIIIKEITNYPFSDTIRFEFELEENMEFPFLFRIPSWCNKPELIINGKKDIQTTLLHEKYIRVERTFKTGDHIILVLPQELRVSRWENNGIAIERGPLVYSLPVKGNWQPIKTYRKKWSGNKRVNTTRTISSEEFPAYNVYPTTKWNYGLKINEKTLEKVKVLKQPVANNPWVLESVPVILKVPAKEILDWNITRTNEIIRETHLPILENGKIVNWTYDANHEIKGDFLLTPELPLLKKPKNNVSKHVDTLSLVPYGCTNLRITIFPDLSGM